MTVSFGDVVTHTALNALTASMNYSMTRAVFVNPSSYRQVTVDTDGDHILNYYGFDLGSVVIRNVHPYLYYRNLTYGESNSLASIFVAPISVAGADVSLPSVTENDTHGVLTDLYATVPWLAPGVIYRIRGVQYAFEVSF